jgi:hypothetical protein
MGCLETWLAVSRDIVAFLGWCGIPVGDGGVVLAGVKACHRRTQGERSILWSSPIDQRSGRSATCLYLSTRSLNSTATGRARW